MDLLSTFEILADDLIQTDDILIDLNTDWTVGDAYQIVVNNRVREVEFHRVSPCGLVLFMDSQTKQITVVSLSHNKSGGDYHYQGKIVSKRSIGRHDCSVIAFSDSKTLHFNYHKPKTKRKTESSLTSFAIVSRSLSL